MASKYETHLQAAALWERDGKFDAAIACLQRAIRLAPDDEERHNAQTWLSRLERDKLASLETDHADS